MAALIAVGGTKAVWVALSVFGSWRTNQPSLRAQRSNPFFLFVLRAAVWIASLRSQ
jgi:hypothetical protein